MRTEKHTQRTIENDIEQRVEITHDHERKGIMKALNVCKSKSMHQQLNEELTKNKYHFKLIKMKQNLYFLLATHKHRPQKENILIKCKQCALNALAKLYEFYGMSD